MGTLIETLVLLALGFGLLALVRFALREQHRELEPLRIRHPRDRAEVLLMEMHRRNTHL